MSPKMKSKEKKPELDDEDYDEVKVDDLDKTEVWSPLLDQSSHFPSLSHVLLSSPDSDTLLEKKTFTNMF